MNKFIELENSFKRGAIDKEVYTQKMHVLHKVLWDYRDFIRNKSVDLIEISKEQVLLTANDHIKMYCDIKDERMTPLDILNFGNYEARELRVIRKLLKKDSVILDIGANVGWYCLNLAKDVPKGRVIAFEPISRTYSYLKKNIIVNNIKNIEVHNFGFSDKEEKATFYYNPKFSSATSMRRLHNNKKSLKIKCILKKMDGVIDTITSNVDFIKCDVEGAELYVIKGGLETICKYRPVIFLEMLRKWSAKYGYHPNEIIEILCNVGYTCFYVRGNTLVKINKISEKTRATNFYFLHTIKHRDFINAEGA